VVTELLKKKHFFSLTSIHCHWFLSKELTLDPLYNLDKVFSSLIKTPKVTTWSTRRHDRMRIEKKLSENIKTISSSNFFCFKSWMKMFFFCFVAENNLGLFAEEKKLPGTFNRISMKILKTKWKDNMFEPDFWKRKNKMSSGS